MARDWGGSSVHTTAQISPLGRLNSAMNLPDEWPARTARTWPAMICMPEQYREDLFGRVGGQKLSYNSPSGTKLRTPKLPVGKLCRDIYVPVFPFGWLPLLKFDWRLLTKNDESRANRLTRASLLTFFFGASPSLLLQKETRVRARSPDKSTRATAATRSKCKARRHLVCNLVS